jgi:hypothetical protein
LRSAFLLAANPVGLAQLAFDHLRHAVDQRLVLRRRRPVPRGFARFVCKLVDEIDDGSHLLVPKTTEPSITSSGSSFAFRIDHQHGLFRSGDDEIELRGLELGASD